MGIRISGIKLTNFFFSFIVDPDFYDKTLLADYCSGSGCTLNAQPDPNLETKSFSKNKNGTGHRATFILRPYWNSRKGKGASAEYYRIPASTVPVHQCHNICRTKYCTSYFFKLKFFA